MDEGSSIPPFYSMGQPSLEEIARNKANCESKRKYFTQRMKNFYANTNPSTLWKGIIKYKYTPPPEEGQEGSYNSLQLTYDGYRKLAYELLFGVTPEIEETENASDEEKHWRKMVFFHHPFLSPAHFLLFSKLGDEKVSAVVLYAFVAKRLLLFRLRVELECVGSLIPSVLMDRATEAAKTLLRGRPSFSSPLSNLLSQDDIEAFILRILPNLRFARDMPLWMKPYYLCHSSQKFMFMCDIHGIGSISIDTFMKSESFSDLLQIFESDPRDVVVPFPVGCPVEVSSSVLEILERTSKSNTMMNRLHDTQNTGKNEGNETSEEDESPPVVDLFYLNEDENEETITAVVVGYEEEGNQVDDLYTVELLSTSKQIKLRRSDLYWSASCSNFLDLENISINNWFFFGLVQRIYDHFTALDVDGDGVLTEKEMGEFNDASFTALVIHRLFEVHIPSSRGDQHVIDFKNYLHFVLATEYPTAPASLQYIWQILDMEDTRTFISMNTLRCFCKEIATDLRNRKMLKEISADMILVEVIDMINPACHEYITLKDIVRSAQQETALPMLLSFRNFLSYDLRDQSPESDAPDFGYTSNN